MVGSDSLLTHEKIVEAIKNASKLFPLTKAMDLTPAHGSGDSMV
jgi:hypothetical protein